MITSAHNARIQLARALLGRRKERDEAGAFVVEGVRLAEEALLAGWLPRFVLYSERLSERGQQLIARFAQAGVETEEVAARLLEELSETEASQGILAVLPRRAFPLPRRPDFVVVADGLRDPGNMGTLLRSAAAAGAQAVLLPPGTTDAFAPKVVRSGMGAHFRLPVLALDWAQIEALCRPLRVFVAEAEQGVVCWQADFRQPLALVVGGEAEGASAEARRLCTDYVTIPMPGRSESLNAAVAAGVLLFEVVRQRRQ